MATLTIWDLRPLTGDTHPHVVPVVRRAGEDRRFTCTLCGWKDVVRYDPENATAADVRAAAATLHDADRLEAWTETPPFHDDPEPDTPPAAEQVRRAWLEFRDALRREARRRRRRQLLAWLAAGLTALALGKWAYNLMAGQDQLDRHRQQYLQMVGRAVRKPL